MLAEPPLPTPDGRATREFADGVHMFGDITYATHIGYRPLKLDLYLPPNPGHAPLPLVVWIHGGGYELGNPRTDWTWPDWSRELARLSARGFAVAAVSYRFSGEARWPAQIDDVRSAIVFLRTHADLWALDRTRIYAWGLSAGGHMAALLNTTSAESPANQRVAAAVDWFGPADLTQQHSDGGSDALTRLFGCDHGHCDADALRRASPIAHVSAATPPMLIIHGEADPLVPVAQSQAFADALHRAGVDVALVREPGLGHGFTGATPAQLDAILAQTFAFFETQARGR
jgi:acetyl esterase/lipase